MREREENLGLNSNIQKIKSCSITSWQIEWVKLETDFIFLAQTPRDTHQKHKIKRHSLPRKKAMTNLRHYIQQGETSLCQRSIYSNLWFSSNHVQMWEMDQKSLAPKNWCFNQAVKDFESLDNKIKRKLWIEIQLQIFIEGLMLKQKL